MAEAGTQSRPSGVTANVVDPLDSPLTELEQDDAGETIEERCFSAALICLEGHYTQSPPMGPQTTARVSSMVTKTLEKTHTLRKVRLVLAVTRSNQHVPG